MQMLHVFMITCFVLSVVSECPFHSGDDIGDALQSFLHSKTSTNEHIKKTDPLEEMNVLLQKNYELTKRHLLENQLKTKPFIFIVSYKIHARNQKILNYFIRITITFICGIISITLKFLLHHKIL